MASGVGGIEHDFRSGEVVMEATSVSGKDEEVVDGKVRGYQRQQPVDEVAQHHIGKRAAGYTGLLVDDPDAKDALPYRLSMASEEDDLGWHSDDAEEEERQRNDCESASVGC